MNYQIDKKESESSVESLNSIRNSRAISKKTASEKKKNNIYHSPKLKPSAVSPQAFNNRPRKEEECLREFRSKSLNFSPTILRSKDREEHNKRSNIEKRYEDEKNIMKSLIAHSEMNLNYYQHVAFSSSNHHGI